MSRFRALVFAIFGSSLAASSTSLPNEEQQGWRARTELAHGLDLPPASQNTPPADDIVHRMDERLSTVPSRIQEIVRHYGAASPAEDDSGAPPSGRWTMLDRRSAQQGFDEAGAPDERSSPSVLDTIAPPRALQQDETRRRLEDLGRRLDRLSRKLDSPPDWALRLPTKEDMDRQSADTKGQLKSMAEAMIEQTQTLTRQLEQLEATLSTAIAEKPGRKEFEQKLQAVSLSLVRVRRQIEAAQTKLSAAVSENADDIAYSEDAIGGKLSILERKLRGALSGAGQLSDLIAKIESQPAPRSEPDVQLIPITITEWTREPSQNGEALYASCAQACQTLSARLGQTFRLLDLTERTGETALVTGSLQTPKAPDVRACTSRTERPPGCERDGACPDASYLRTTVATCVRSAP